MTSTVEGMTSEVPTAGMSPGAQPGGRTTAGQRRGGRSLSQADRTARLQELLRDNGRLLDELGRCNDGLWPKGHEPVAVAIQRVFDRKQSYVLELAVTAREGRITRDLVLLAEVLDGDAGEHAQVSWARLRREHPEQLVGITGRGVSGLPELGLVLRRPGLDRRIPALDLMRRFEGAAPGLVSVLGGGPVTATLLSHRLERRAVIRVAGAKQSVVVKAYRRHATHAADTAQRASSLGSDLVPQATMELPEHSAVVWEDAGPGSPGEWSVPGADATRRAGELLARLHTAAPFPAPRHTPVDEVAIVARAAHLAARARPELEHLAASAAISAITQLQALPAVQPAVIHRDAHPGQLCAGNRGPRLLDLDCMSLGDPAVDLGNYAAYLQLAGRQGDVPVLLQSYGASGALAERVRTWQLAAQVRLAAICVLSTTRVRQGALALEECAR